MRAARCKRFAGFTLIELLVVVAIIGILASLLIPGLAQAKRKAAVATCLNNFKQLQLSLHFYAEDNGGRFPYNHGLPGFLPQMRFAPVWAALGMRFENDNWTIFQPADATNFAALQDPEISTLSPYYLTADILKCPSDKSYLVIDGVKHARVRSYSMNCFIAPAHTIGMWRHYTFATIESTGLTMPGSTWSFTDEHEDTIDDSSFLMLEEGNLDWFGLPTARHGKSTPFSFLDGHCETHRWVEPGTLAPVQRKRVVRTPAKLGDRDMFWIRNAASPVLMQ